MLTDEYMNALSLAELVELHANVGARIACLKETGRVEAIQKARELCAKYAIEPATIFDDAENGRKVRRCRIPDDCIDSKRYPLFMARAVLKELIESLQSTQGVKPC